MVLLAEPSNAVADGVPLSQPFLNGRELELVGEVLRSGRLCHGSMLTRFEQSVATFVDARHAVAVANRITALQIAARAIGWGPGDEIVASPLSAASAVAVARATGASIVYVDVEPAGGHLDLAAVDAVVTARTRGLLAVDAFGWPIDHDAVAALASAHRLTVLELACEAFGARRGERAVGSGTAWSTVFAASPDGLLTTGEGAMLCTDDDATAAAWRELVAGDHHLSDVASAIGVAQLEKLPRTLAMRQLVADEYTRHLDGVPGLLTPLPDHAGAVRSWGAYWILLDEDVDPTRVAAELAARGVETARYRSSFDHSDGVFPHAESIARRALAIPFFPHMSPQQQVRVVSELCDVVAAH